MRDPKRYRIEPLAGRRGGAIKITAEEFNELAVAKRSLVVATGFEEKFYLLLENYAEFERALLDLALKRLIFAGGAWSDFQDDILTVNRRLANLLSAARSYLDQVDHELAILFDRRSDIVKAVRRARATEYDSRLGYRALEALRNYQQHRGFPVHNLAFGVRRDPVGDQVFVAHAITPSVSVPALRRDGGVKAAILEELATKGPLVPLSPLVREYVEGLAVVHAVLRTAVAAQVKRWEDAVRLAMVRGRKRFGNNRMGFVAVARTTAGSREEEVQMFQEFMARRQLLEGRSRHAAMLAKHYVSGRVAEADA